MFLTGHECPGKPEASVHWEDYARLKATLCIYMGMHRLASITRRLQDAGLSPDTPAVIVQAATTAGHHEVAATVGTVAARARAAGITTPAIVIIGEVAAHRPGIPDDPRGERAAIFSTEDPGGDSATETAAAPAGAGASTPGETAAFPSGCAAPP